MNYRTAPLLDAKHRAEARRVELFGDPPVNIFSELRRGSDLSHDQLSRLMHISKQALIRLEQGTFNEPLPTAVEYWVRRGHNELTIRDNYDWFRQSMRTRHRLLFGSSLDFSLQGPHPFRQLRERAEPPLNPSEIAKMICIPQATIQHFERKWKHQKTVPRELLTALHSLGYLVPAIDAFAIDYTIWRQRMLKEGHTPNG